MKAGTIKVVAHGDELFFECMGVLLDTLDADDFYNASIKIWRDGQEIDKGTVLEIGPFSLPIFGGLTEVMAEFPTKADYSRLFPDYFEAGDEIQFVLSHPFDWEIDYRNLYAEDEVAKKLSDFQARLDSMDADEEWLAEHEIYMQLFSKELSLFKFPEKPIWRRIE